MDESIAVFGHGGTSIGWKVGHIILKTIRIDKCTIDFDEKNAEKIRIDAMAMEHRTSSPRIINIYGLGGFSQLLEFAEGGRLQRDIIKKLSSEKKLEYAIAIAQSVADLHGPENATLVHGDMDSSQFLLMADGTLKLNDFNQGFFLRHNKARKTPCGFQKEEYFNTGKRWTKPEMSTPCAYNNFVRSRKTGRKIDARALEELMGMPLSEKIDIYGIGAMFYYLLTRNRPYACQPTQVCSTDFMGRPQKTISTRKMMELKRANILPTLPTEIANSTIPEIISIQHAMTLAFQRDPEKRPSAQFIANLLKETRDSLREKRKETQKRSDKKDNESENSHEVNLIDTFAKNTGQLSKKSNQNKTSGTRNMHLNLQNKTTGHIFL
jgi:serine/threonine protein kinase